MHGAIADREFEARWTADRRLTPRTGRFVAIVGSGPAGLAAAQRINRAGHFVTVFERAAQLGGCLRPALQSELDGHVRWLASQGVVFRSGVTIGVDIAADWLRDDYDAIVLAAGTLDDRSRRRLAGFDVGCTADGAVWCDARWLTTVPRVFAAGRIRAREATIHEAIADGRGAAHAVDLSLMGRSVLPATIQSRPAGRCSRSPGRTVSNNEISSLTARERCEERG